MPKKQSTKKRTEVKALSKDQKLSKGDMKKVKGGNMDASTAQWAVLLKPPTTKVGGHAG